MVRLALGFLITFAFSVSAHAQSSFAVYNVGGDASAEAMADAEEALVAALEAQGMHPEQIGITCDQAGFCRDATLEVTGLDAVAVFRLWGIDEVRVRPHVMLAFGDEEGLVIVEGDVEEGVTTQAVVESLTTRALTLWPRRAGVTLELDTSPSGQQLWIDGVLQQTPFSGTMLLGEHVIQVGEENPVVHEFIVDENSPDVISIVLDADPLDQVVLHDAFPIGTPLPPDDAGHPGPSYVFGGILVGAGLLAWIQPAVALSRNGDCARRCGEPNQAHYTFGGKEIAFAILGSAAIIGGLTIIIARPFRGGVSMSADSAALTFSGDF